MAWFFDPTLVVGGSTGNGMVTGYRGDDGQIVDIHGDGGQIVTNSTGFGVSSGHGAVSYEPEYFEDVSGNLNNSASKEASLDPTGYDQSNWDLNATRELLEEQRAYNSAEAQKTRDWQERMSNTAYQRAVEDLQAAGLNKWLAITGSNGNSASTPSGATATSSSGDASTPSPVLAKAIIEALTSVFSSATKLVKLFV